MDTRYEEALERARKIKHDIETIGCAMAPDMLEEIFPELRESEDERIRKELIGHCKDLVRMNQDDKVMLSVYEPWLAYLEKQKEQSFTHHEIDESLQDAVTHQMEDDGDVDDFVRRGIDDIALKYAMLGAEWQKEQKPAEWSEEDEHCLHQLILFCENCMQQDSEAIRCAIWLKSLRPVKQEWSEGDEKTINMAIETLEQEGFLILAERLKSLRPQPKNPVLSEKMVICLKRTLDFLREEHNAYTGEDFTNEIAVLEWLITHPTMVLSYEPHWKPSEEQMEALNRCVDYLEESDNEDADIMVELYEQLKAL